MANLNKTKLDANQCLVDAFDGVEEAQRVSIVNSIEYAIELSAADGDNVSTYKNNITVCNLSVNSNGGSPDISEEIDSTGYSSFCVYTNINGNPVASGYILVQGSCDTAGNNWHDISNEIYSGKRPPAASASNDATDKRGASGAIEFSSKRIRLYVPVAGKPSSGTVQYSIVLRT